MNERYEHILTPLDAQIAIEKRNVAALKDDEGWDEALADAQQRLEELELLYDIVDEGLLALLKANYTAVQLLLAEFAATQSAGVPA